VFLIVSLWLVPAIIGGFEPNNQDVFLYLSEPTGYIVRFGHIDPAHVWYHGWPGYPFVVASLIRITGLEIPATLINMSAFIVQMAALPIWYYVLRMLLPKGKDNLVWAALWVFYLGSWTGESRFAPQYLAVIILYVLIVLVIRTNAGVRFAEGVRGRVLVVLLTTVLVMTHGLTGFAAALVMSVMLLFRRVSWRLLALTAILFVVWNYTMGYNEIYLKLPQVLKTAFNPELMFNANVGQRISGNASHVAVNQIRIVFSLIFFLMAGVGATLSMTRKKQPVSDVSGRRSVAFSLLLVVGSFVLMVPILVYSGQLLIRVFLLASIPLAYFASRLIDSRIGGILVGILLSIILPLHFIAHYGNQTIDYSSSKDVAASQFVAQNVKDYYLTGRLVYSDISFPQYKLDGGINATYDQLLWNQQGEMERVPGMNNDWPNVIVIDERARRQLEFSSNDTKTLDNLQNHLDITTNCSLAFVNSDVKLYVQKIP
jgi:hypothetical protein